MFHHVRFDHSNPTLELCEVTGVQYRNRALVRTPLIPKFNNNVIPSHSEFPSSSFLSLEWWRGFSSKLTTYILSIQHSTVVFQFHSHPFSAKYSSHFITHLISVVGHRAVITSVSNIIAVTVRLFSV